MGGRVLLVDDDPDLVELVKLELGREEIETTTASCGRDALRQIDEDPPAAVVLDLLLPDMHGRQVLAELRSVHPEIPVVVFTKEGDIDGAVECMKLGAVDYIQKPFERTRLTTSVRNARTQGLLRARIDSLADHLWAGAGFAAMLGRSEAIRKSLDLLARAARSDVTVLLEGESGTGKEVAGRAVHAESKRRSGPFVVVNCGAIPEALIESELFGHEKGSFTGASASRKGQFESAEGGSICLDEVGELRLDLQVRLLRVIQDHCVQRLGGGPPRRIDVRVIAATNRDLKAEVARRAFREDLYYRLAVFPVRLPPLRDRRSDILLLAAEFLERSAARHGRRISGFTDEARRTLESYSWPGNVRQLENAIERASILEDGPLISLGSLPDDALSGLDATVQVLPPAPPAEAAGGVAGPRPRAPAPAEAAATPGAIVPLEQEERRIITRALDLTGWNVPETAQRLGVGRATIYRKIERFGLGACRVGAAKDSRVPS